jgi:hypothetical protein
MSITNNFKKSTMFMKDIEIFNHELDLVGLTKSSRR